MFFIAEDSDMVGQVPSLIQITLFHTIADFISKTCYLTVLGFPEKQNQ